MTPTHAVCLYSERWGHTWPAITLWPPVERHGRDRLMEVLHAGSHESARAHFAELIGMNKPVILGRPT